MSSEEGHPLPQTVTRCSSCGWMWVYPKPLCPKCHCAEFTPHEVPGRGQIYSFTEVHRAPTPALAAEVPYTIAVIDLEGPQILRLPARVTGKVACGDWVERIAHEGDYPLYAPPIR